MLKPILDAWEGEGSRDESSLTFTCNTLSDEWEQAEHGIQFYSTGDRSSFCAHIAMQGEVYEEWVPLPDGDTP